MERFNEIAFAFLDLLVQADVFLLKLCVDEQGRGLLVIPKHLVIGPDNQYGVLGKGGTVDGNGPLCGPGGEYSVFRWLTICNVLESRRQR